MDCDRRLQQIVRELNVPLITGSTSQRKRNELFEKFKAGEVRVLAVSKVANFAVDLPDAAVAIQVSGTFGSRQEEVTRSGILIEDLLDSPHQGIKAEAHVRGPGACEDSQVRNVDHDGDSCSTATDQTDDVQQHASVDPGGQRNQTSARQQE